MKNSSVQKAYKEEDVQLFLLYENRIEKRSLRDLAKEFDVSHGVIQRLLKGQFPKRKDIRTKMSLSPLKQVEICAECGRIKTKYHRHDYTRPPRIAIRLDNPESAANSILKHMDAELVGVLRRALDNRTEEK